MTRDNSPSICIHFGQAVRKRRLYISISQEELGFRSGLHRTYVADIERGSRNPSLKAIAQLALGLSTPLSQLFQITEEIQGGKG
jgi:transcriptional regulator with XRE-family HTH domain